MESPLTPEILAEQKARHVAFLQARLVSAEALAEWVAAAPAIHEALLSARVDDGTLAAASWHATLAPLYAALLFALAVLPLSIFCAPPGRSAVAAQSYCGLVVA